MKRKKYVIIFSFVVSLVFIIGTVEAYFRIFHYEILKTQTFPLVYQPDAYAGYSYIPNTVSDRITPSYNNLNIKTNAHGFFGPEFSLVKDPFTFRILIVSYSSASEGEYINLLQKEFDQRGASNIEIINCSIDGTNLDWHHYLMIKNRLLAYNPNLVLFDTNIPFLREDYTRECYKGYVLEYSSFSDSSRLACMEAVDLIKKNKPFTDLYDFSFIVRAICKKMVDKHEYDFGSFTQKYIAPYRKKKILSGSFKKYDYSIAQTVKHLKNLSDTITSMNGKLIIFNYFNSERSAAKEKICSSNKINYINLGIDPEYYESQLRLKYDGHPNQKGFEEISKRFFSALVNNNLVPVEFLFDKKDNEEK